MRTRLHKPACPVGILLGLGRSSLDSVGAAWVSRRAKQPLKAARERLLDRTGAPSSVHLTTSAPRLRDLTLESHAGSGFAPLG